VIDHWREHGRRLPQPSSGSCSAGRPMTSGRSCTCSSRPGGSTSTAETSSRATWPASRHRSGSSSAAPVRSALGAARAPARVRYGSGVAGPFPTLGTARYPAACPATVPTRPDTTGQPRRPSTPHRKRPEAADPAHPAASRPVSTLPAAAQRRSSARSRATAAHPGDNDGPPPCARPGRRWRPIVPLAGTPGRECTT
jgi:hypothetical protein